MVQVGPPPSSVIAPVILKQSQMVADITFSLGTAYSQDWIVMAPGWLCWCTLLAALAVTCNSVNGTRTVTAVAPNAAPTVLFFTFGSLCSGSALPPTPDVLGTPCYRTVTGLFCDIKTFVERRQPRQFRHESLF